MHDAVTENQANTFSTEPAWSNVKLTPHHIRVSIEISRTLLEQSSRDVDELILGEISLALSEELDRQILRGVSSDEEISGIVNTTGITSDAIGTLASLTARNAHGFIVGAEAALGTAKTPQPYFWLLNSATREKLRESKAPSANHPLFSDDKKIIGYDTFVTENLEDSDLHLISPKFVVVGLWHDDLTFDLIVDGYSKSNQGKIVLTMSIMADAALVTPKALNVLSES